jgi:hypothetical protein
MEFVDRMRAKIDAQKRRAATLYEQAKRRIPKEYQDFLMLLPQHIKLGNFTAKDDLLEIPGVATWDGKTFLSIEIPYVSVDGRVQMFRDEHAAAKKTFRITFRTAWAAELASVLAAIPHPVDAATVGVIAEQVPSKLKDVMVCTVESDIYGVTMGSAKIGWDGEGVDRTNPIENAETSAVGRALGFMGYGLIGGGIASYEEVKQAIAEQETAEQTAKPSGALPAPLPVPSETPPDTSPPAATPSALDPTAVADGPCVDCGVEIPPAMRQYIRRLRAQGKAVRWAHSTIPGVTCQSPAVRKASGTAS